MHAILCEWGKMLFLIKSVELFTTIYTDLHQLVETYFLEVVPNNEDLEELLSYFSRWSPAKRFHG